MTLSKTIGELEAVPIRDVWPDEARDLTPWLAENLEALGRALGMDLELDGSEVAVGPFSADLLLHDANTGKHVVVENMMGNTDHDHLGKIITYAAGLGASHAVLVAETFRQEHRSALQWLNANSRDSVSFLRDRIQGLEDRWSRCQRPSWMSSSNPTSGCGASTPRISTSCRGHSWRTVTSGPSFCLRSTNVIPIGAAPKRRRKGTG